MAQENMEGLAGSSEGSRKRSIVWDHFVHLEYDEKAICKKCNKVFQASSKRNGTSTLSRHYRRCSRQDGPPAKQQWLPPRAPGPNGPSAPSASSILLPEPSIVHPAPSSIPPETSLPHPAQGRYFNQEECDAKLARMITFHGYPSSIVEDECFRGFVCGLNPHFQMPSRSAVERICRLRAEDAMNQLKETLGSNQGQISLATGTAHIAQGKALYMAWQFVDDEWALQKRIAQVFAVVSFPPYHHDTLLGAEEVSIELDEGILEQLSVATTSTTLKEAVLRWVHPGRLFSVAWGEALEEHLEQKDYLKNLCLEKKQCSQLFDVPRVFCVTYTSDVLNTVADAIFSKLENSYVQNCFKAVRDLSLSQEQRDQILSDLGLKHLGRYDKRWFSYYCALEVLHKENSANNATSANRQELDTSRIGDILRRSKVNGAELMKLLGLSTFEESILTGFLRKIMGMLYRSLVTISSPGRSTSSLCLQELMKLLDALQYESIEANEVPGIATAYANSRGFARGEDMDTAVKKAQGVVEKFLQDSCQCLSIPVVLDPRFKLEYIESVFMAVTESDEDAQASIKKVRGTVQYLFNEQEHKRRSQLSGGEGTSSGAVGTGTAAMDVDMTEELERYLQDGLVHAGDDDGFDVLQWWSVNSWRYPTVARMARDALAMPASDILTPEDVSSISSMVCWSYGSNAKLA